MTILDFLLQPKSEILNHFRNHGITSHHDFEKKFNKYKQEIELFCKEMNLEPGTCQGLTADDYSSYTVLSFHIVFDFQKNVDWSVCTYSAYDDEIKMVITGNSANTLKITQLHTGNNFHVYAKNFDYSNSANSHAVYTFQYTIENCKKNKLSDSIVYIKAEAAKVMPHIEYYLKVLENGLYIEAYNKLHTDMLTFSTNRMEFYNNKFYINIRKDAHFKYGYDMDILEIMMFMQYSIDNGLLIFSEGLPDNLDIEKILEECRSKYVLSDKSREKMNEIRKLDDEFKHELKKLVKKLSEKYNVHESYFYGTDGCYVDIPAEIDNNTDFSKSVR